MDSRLDLTTLCPMGGLWVELGVARGDFGAAVLNERPDLQYLGVDRWAGDRGHDAAEEAVARGRLEGRGKWVTVWRLRFDEALGMLNDECADVIYVDGYAHGGQVGGRTLADAWPKVRPGGVLAGHDYDRKYMPTVEAVDRFARRYGLGVHLTGERKLRSWWVRKPAVVPVEELLRGKRVAVVGNGPSTLGRGMGPWIDAADVVVRFNCYETAGFEDDVGRRCDLWATTGGKNQVPGAGAPLANMALLVHDKKRPAYTPDRVWRVPPVFGQKLRERVLALSARTWDRNKTIWSTGTMTLAWLLEVVGVEKVLVAGMDAFEKSASTQHHYWDPTPYSKPVEHDGEAERRLWREWGERLEFL